MRRTLCASYQLPDLGCAVKKTPAAPGGAGAPHTLVELLHLSPFSKGTPRFLWQGVFVGSEDTPCSPPCKGGQTSALRRENVASWSFYIGRRRFGGSSSNSWTRLKLNTTLGIWTELLS